MKKQWSSIRIQACTLERIKAERARMLEEYVKTGRHRLNRFDSEVTVDYLVNWLLDQVQAHRGRATKQKERRRAAKAPPKEETAGG